MDIERIIADLKRDEGFSPVAYWDADQWTYGYGTKAPGQGAVISYKEAKVALEERVVIAIRDFEDIFRDCRENINEVRAELLVQMAYNLGKTKLMKFRRMIHFIRLNDWMQAAYEAQDSKWFKQTGNRAKRIVRQLATGKREDS